MVGNPHNPRTRITAAGAVQIAAEGYGAARRTPGESRLDIFLQQVINGLTLGSVYAVVALGYTMVYGIIQLINFAHGEVVMIGAMVAFTVINALAPKAYEVVMNTAFELFPDSAAAKGDKKALSGSGF